MRQKKTSTKTKSHVRRDSHPCSVWRSSGRELLVDPVLQNDPLDLQSSYTVITRFGIYAMRNFRPRYAGGLQFRAVAGTLYNRLACCDRATSMYGQLPETNRYIDNRSVHPRPRGLPTLSIATCAAVQHFAPHAPRGHGKCCDCVL